MHTISNSVTQYFRCPDEYARFEVPAVLPPDSGYFRFGADLVCFGRAATEYRRASATESLYECLPATNNGAVSLAFFPDEVIDNLRREHYAAAHRPSVSRKGMKQLINTLYYALRPWMPVKVRKHLQRIYRKGARNVAFPHWPNDTTVDDFLSRLVTLSVEHAGTRMPFIWFWPDGAPACITITHDVESQTGYEFCPQLMDIDARFGFSSSFQIVPEERYKPSLSLITEINARGFEVNIHDFNHDGHLFRDWPTFAARAEKIRNYAKQFGAAGFRSAVMYRNPDWLALLGFEYDMSSPNAAHLDPQAGGCCTLMPFFIGHTLELPLTTIQDYTLFHLLNSRSIELWQQQTEMIVRRHGLASFLIHPDYVIGHRERKAYVCLLEYLQKLRDTLGIWAARPKEVNDWWRARDAMQLVERDGTWRIEGPQSEHARVAFAEVRGGKLVFEIAGGDWTQLTVNQTAKTESMVER